MGDGVVGGVEKNDPIFLGWVAPVAERPYFLSIKSDISFRISGSFSYSSLVKRDNTKSVSPILLRSASLAVPMRRRGKSSVPR